MSSSPKDAKREASSSFDSKSNANFSSTRSPFDRKLRTLAIRMRNAVIVTRRSKGLLKFEAVFLGNKAVDWMVADCVAETRAQAVEIGKEMLRQQIIQRISVKTWIDQRKKERNQYEFKDSKKGYYRFNEALIATYLLHINVVEASHLLGKKRNGTSSPFVTIDSVRESCETRIIEDKVNPVWNEKFTLAINNPESEHFVVRVWNWLDLAKNNFLGEVTIPVADVLRAEELLRLNAENEHEFDTFAGDGGDSGDGDDEREGEGEDKKRRGSGFKYRYDAPAGGDGRRRRVIELPSGKGSPVTPNNSNKNKHGTVANQEQASTDTAHNINNSTPNGTNNKEEERDNGASRSSLPLSSAGNGRQQSRQSLQSSAHSNGRFDGTKAYTNNRGTTTIVKWYKLQKRSERSSVQGHIALTMSLEKFQFSESLRQNRIINVLPTIINTGHLLIQSDNAHSRAKRGRSEVLINGKVVGHHGAQGTNTDDEGDDTDEDLDNRGPSLNGGNSNSNNSYQITNMASKMLTNMAMSPSAITKRHKKMMLHRALSTVTRWQLRVRLRNCEGVKHAGKAKDMKVTSALIHVAPLVQWKNYVVIRLDGHKLKVRSSTVKKATGPNWNNEELVIDDIPVPLSGNVDVRLYQVLGLELVQREVGRGSVLLSSLPRQLEEVIDQHDISDDEDTNFDSSSSKSSNSGSNKSKKNKKDGASAAAKDDAYKDEYQHGEAIDVPLSLRASNLSNNYVSNGRLRCTMILCPSSGGLDLTSSEDEEDNNSHSHNSSTSSTSSTSSSSAQQVEHGGDFKNNSNDEDNQDTNGGTDSKNKNKRGLPRGVLNPGAPLSRVLADTTLDNISVERVVRLMLATPAFEAHRGRFAKIVWDKQGFRHMKCTSWSKKQMDESKEAGYLNDSEDSEEEYSDGEMETKKSPKKSYKSKHGKKRKKLKRKTNKYQKIQSKSASKLSSNRPTPLKIGRSLSFGHNINPNQSNSETLYSKLPRQVGDYRSLNYQVSNKWSSQCRVRCWQVVEQYDAGGGGIVIMETRQLPDIPWGRNFVIMRKISILYVGVKKTKITISVELKNSFEINGFNVISQPNWPVFVQDAIAKEMYKMCKREESLVTDEIMAVSAGNSLKKMFQTPDRDVSIKRVCLLVTGIVFLVLLIVLVIFTMWLNWDYLTVPSGQPTIQSDSL